MVEFDRQAWFAQQIFVHEGRLRAYMRRYLKAPSDIADGIQELYARLLSLSDGQLHAIRSPHAFLFAAARNLALEWHRRERFLSRGPAPETGAVSLLDDSPGADEQLSASQERELLARAIAQLPARCREVLILRKLYGLTQKEIAARLGITENTVEKHAANGVRLCAAYLSDSEQGRARAPAAAAGAGRSRAATPRACGGERLARNAGGRPPWARPM